MGKNTMLINETFGSGFFIVSPAARSQKNADNAGKRTASKHTQARTPTYRESC